MSRPPKRIVASPETGEAAAPPQATGKGRYMTVPVPAAEAPPDGSPGSPAKDEPARTVPASTKGRHRTVALPTDNVDSVVVEHHDESASGYVEPDIPVPTTNKYDGRASGARAQPGDAENELSGSDGADEPVETDPIHPVIAESSAAVVEEGSAPEYVEPYVPMPSSSKYDRRASGAAAEPSESVPESAIPGTELPIGAELSTGAELTIERVEVDLTNAERVEVDFTDTAPAIPSAPPAALSVYERQLQEAEERAAAARVATEAPDPFENVDGLTYWQRHSANLPRLEEQSD